MARYTGPKCRLCRREGVKLYLKGERCEGPKCALVRRQTPPGQHGAKRQRRPSEYALQLREKQKVKRIYGLLERQLRRYFNKARAHRGETGIALLQSLELRLDNVVYRLGLGRSRAHARQLVRQGKIAVNGKKVDIPSFSLTVGDEISFKGSPAEMRKNVIVPPWLSWDKKKQCGKVEKLPSRESIGQSIDESLVVEYYSR